MENAPLVALKEKALMSAPAIVKKASSEPSLGTKFVTAGLAACFADLCTFPLDTAKVRLQVCLWRQWWLANSVLLSFSFCLTSLVFTGAVACQEGQVDITEADTTSVLLHLNFSGAPDFCNMFAMWMLSDFIYLLKCKFVEVVDL